MTDGVNLLLNKGSIYANRLLGDFVLLNLSEIADKIHYSCQVVRIPFIDKKKALNSDNRRVAER